MTIEVHIMPNARKEGVEKTVSGVFKVAVNAPPQDGKANTALIELLAEYFRVPKSAIQIVRGHSSRKKIVVIDG